MATFTVDTVFDETGNDGRLSLREAVARANAAPGADAIAFAARLEGRTLVLDGGQLRVTDDLRIDGNRDGNRSEVTIDAGGESRVLMVGGAATALRLEDLTVSGGTIAAGAADGNGGGILLAAGNDLTLAGCTIEDNRVGGFLPGANGDYQSGAGVHAGTGSRLTVIDSLLQGNQALGLGGAIYAAADARVVVRDSELANNQSYDGGGAIALNGSRSLAVTDSTIGYNSNGGESSGGGIILLDSTATIADSTLFRNSTLLVGSGAGISAIGSRVTLTDSTIAGNRAGFGSAVSADAASALVLRGCTVTGNGSNYTYGGAISSRGRLELADSIVAGNFYGAAPVTPRRHCRPHLRLERAQRLRQRRRRQRPGRPGECSGRPPVRRARPRHRWRAAGAQRRPDPDRAAARRPQQPGTQRRRPAEC